VERGYRVVLPHDAHATYDVPVGPGYGQVVPAAAAARVAEWSLATAVTEKQVEDQIKLTATGREVDFEQPPAPRA
jgi:phage-related protein